MATTCLTSSMSSSSSSSSMFCKTRTRIIEPFVTSSIHFRYRKLSCSLSHSSEESFTYSSSLLCPTPTDDNKTELPPVEDNPLAATTPADAEDDLTSKNRLRPCELYVCNLPRSCDISELLNLFKTYGTVQSVEVSRNAETGISRGCGYVTVSSIDEAKAAIAALDGSDFGGREMRIRFSADVNTGRTNLEGLNSTPNKNLIFESPYKIYVGNLAWSVKPDDLRNLFSQFGTVVSTRLLHDRKAGKNRVFGFLSFSSAAEREASLSLHGTGFCGRTLVVRELLKKNEA